MKKKRILVSWTGGMDSTYLVLKLLNEGHYVSTVYTEIVYNVNQSIREKNAIGNMLEQFNEHVNYLGHKELNVINYSFNYSLQQVPCIIQGLLGAYQDHDEVAIGYIMNDDAISYISDIIKIWNSYRNICYDKFPKITFPIIKDSKSSIYKLLPKFYKEHVVWYERADSKKSNCNKCPSCIRMKPILKQM